jgi:hypothetical protein
MGPHGPATRSGIFGLGNNVIGGTPREDQAPVWNSQATIRPSAPRWMPIMAPSCARPQVH